MGKQKLFGELYFLRMSRVPDIRKRGHSCYSGMLPLLDPESPSLWANGDRQPFLAVMFHMQCAGLFSWWQSRADTVSQQTIIGNSSVTWEATLPPIFLGHSFLNLSTMNTSTLNSPQCRSVEKASGDMLVSLSVTTVISFSPFCWTRAKPKSCTCPGNALPLCYILSPLLQSLFLI